MKKEKSNETLNGFIYIMFMSIVAGIVLSSIAKTLINYIG